MVLAEKIVTASQRGITSTRWRDFADIYLLTGQHRLVAGDIHAAINKVSTYRNTEMGPLRHVLDGYPALAQAKWHAWRTRQNLEDRLPADFHEGAGSHPRVYRWVVRYEPSRYLVTWRSDLELAAA